MAKRRWGTFWLRVSVVLLLLMGGMWIRSYYTQDALCLTGLGLWYHIGSVAGELFVAWELPPTHSKIGPGFRYLQVSFNSQQAQSLRDFYGTRAGFAVLGGDLDGFLFPYWIAMLVMGGLVAYQWRAWRRRRRAGSGFEVMVAGASMRSPTL